MTTRKYKAFEPVQSHKAHADAWLWIKSMLAAGHRLTVEIKPETRTNDQNARMWAMLTEIAKQVEWYGQKLNSTDWKHILSASLKKQRAVPGIDGGFVVLGLSTSKMSIADMSELMTLMEAFGAEKGVKFTERARKSAYVNK